MSNNRRFFLFFLTFFSIFLLSITLIQNSTPSLALEPTPTHTPTPLPTATKLPPTPTIQSTPTKIPVEIIAQTPHAELMSTVSSLQINEKTTSFVPSGKFTNKVYEQIFNSSFQVIVDYEDQEYLQGGTGWLIKKHGNTIYIVTNRHVLAKASNDDIVNPDNIYIYQPFNHRVELTKVKIVSATDRDLAILRGTIPSEEATDLKPLDYQDDYHFSKGEQALLVSWPMEFRYTEIISQAILGVTNLTAAGYMSFDYDRQEKNNVFWGQGLISDGSSGAGVTIVKNGKPLVVAIISGRADQAIQTNEGFTAFRSIAGHVLNLDELLLSFEE